MVVKVCGMSHPESIRLIAELHPSMMGFIFYPPSPRNACSLNPEVVKSIPEDIERIGVFVNSTIDRIMDDVQRYSLTGVQLHGNETPEVCRQLRSSSLKVIKAIGIGEGVAMDRIVGFEDTVDMFVFDTATSGFGGSGKKFDWTHLKEYRLSVPFLLSGGIGPEDAEAVSEASATLPQMAGVDINSRFEISPGRKSAGLVKAFMEAILK